MPEDTGGEGKRSGLADGLFVRSNPLLITDGNCSETLNMNFDPLSAEESLGVRRMGAKRPQTAGVRFRPMVKRTSVKEMTRWRDGYLFSPVHPLSGREPYTIEGHIRLEETTIFPESGSVLVPKTYTGLTGRWRNTVGSQRPGGEHQFFPIVSRGARAVEVPIWTLGVGVIRPEGLKTDLGADDSDADSIYPIFAWFDQVEQRLRVAAANFRIEAGVDYHIAAVFTNTSGKWYVNGAPVVQFAAWGLSQLPLVNAPLFAIDSQMPIYMGRCYTREPDISYTPQHDRKHIYMGKFDVDVTGLGGPGIIFVANNQLGFSLAQPTSYFGYRVRVLTGPSQGKIFWIKAAAGVNNDATVQFTLNAVGHGITATDFIDVIPPIEPLAVDATIQEVRLWNISVSAETMPKLAKMRAISDIRRDTPTEDVHPLMMPDWGALSPRDLNAYWPLDDGGGNVCKELIGGANAYFAPSGVSLTDQNIGSSSSRAFFMDGETQAVQVDLSEDPNYRINWPWNLGKNSGAENHWNVCFRMQFFLGSHMEGGVGGNVQDNLYQVLASIGSRVGGVPPLEVRVTFHGPFNLHLYLALPDGTFAEINHTLATGRWYNAIVGIEAPPYKPGELAETARTHYAYFRFLDANLQPGGAFSASFLLKRVMVDPGVDFIASFGASVRGNPDLGVGENNHAMLGVSCLGVGHHPAHLLTFGVAPTLLLSEINPLISFTELEDAEGCAPLITGQDGGCTLTQNSRTLVTASAEPLPSYIKRFPIKVAHAVLEIVKRGEATQRVPNSLVIQTVAGNTADLFTAHFGPSIYGAELRAQVWAAYTNLTTVEPGFDTDLSAGTEPPSRWAITKDVFSNLAGGVLHFYVAVDPTYEFVSPLRIFPVWDCGIVDRLDNRIECLKEYKTSEGRSTILAIGGGSLFDVDERWRKGGPFSPNDYAFQFRYRPGEDRRERSRRRDESALLVRSNLAYRNEAIKWDSEFSIAAGVEFVCFEADVWLDTLEGRHTITASVYKQYTVVGGVLQATWKKNHHLYIRDGDAVFEICDEANGFLISARTTCNCSFNVNEWTRIQVEIRCNALVPNEIVSVTFRINGRAVETSVITHGGPFDNTMVPASIDGTSYIGSFGHPNLVAFVDTFRGKIGGFAYRNSDDNYSYKGVDYEVCRVDREPGQVVMPMLEGGGLIMGTTATVVGVFLGEIPIPVGFGMGQLPDQESSVTVFGDVAYINTGFTRPWRYDFDSFTPAGIRPPVGKLSNVQPTRIPLRVQDLGADLPAVVGRASAVRVSPPPASPHLSNFVVSIPQVAEGDVGALVYIPSDHQMGGATDWPCGFIGIISSINMALQGYVVLPPPFPEHASIAANESSWTAFRTAKIDPPFTATSSFKKAVMKLQSTTPWGATRLQCDGKNNNSVPQTEALAEGPTQKGCLHFRGNVFFESGPFQSSALPFDRGKVVSAKGYIKLDVPSSSGDEMVIWEMAKDGDSGCFRIMVFEGGRLKFEFFDTLLGAFRSIATTGKVISPNQWFYLHFRYKFKQAGSSILDTVGGWEPDLRWLRKGNPPALWKTNDFRDLLQIYACEGLHEIQKNDRNADAVVGYFGDVDEGAPCTMMTLPGCESQVGGVVDAGAKNAFNHSQQLLNVGLLKSAPYLTPEPGDQLYPTGAGVLASSPKSGINITMVANAIGPLFSTVSMLHQVGGDGTASPGPLAAFSQFELPAGYVLPRTCSMNRDDAWNRRPEFGTMPQSTQICKIATPFESIFHASMVPANTLVGNTQNLASYAVVGAGSSYSKQDCWAVLLRIWSKTAAGGAPVGAIGAVPFLQGGEVCRTFAIVHLGINDLGESNFGGTAVGNYRIFVTDDKLYGGDGGGPLTTNGVTTFETGSKWHATIELMNGLNQARISTNRLVWPSLLEHGPNPVGKMDSPDQSQCSLRLGGTTGQTDQGTIRRGFRGYMADVGFLFRNLDKSNGNIYTDDCMAPDAFFTGPKDTRFQSLPRIAFGNNALILDDPTGTPIGTPTAVYRCAELQGNKLAPDTAFSSQEAPTLFAISSKMKSVPPQGTHKFWASYWDRKQRVESNLSEEFLVAIEGETGGGDFLLGDLSFDISGVQVSGDRREYMSRRIYKSQAFGALPFLFAQIDDNATVRFTPRVDELALPFQQQGFFDNGRPPRCKAVFATETNLIYVGLDDAPNVVNISKAFKPEHVPGTKIVFAESTRGGGVIGANITRGTIVVAKRNALFVVNTSGSSFKTSVVGHSVGALSHNSITDVDGMLYFLSQKGVFTFAGNQIAYEASELIDAFFQSILDVKGMWKSAGANLIDRGQYLAIVKRKDDFEPRALLHAEQRFDKFGNREYTWGLVDYGIPFTALTEFEDIHQESGRVVLATATGLIAEYNNGEGIGFTQSPFLGQTQAQVAAGSTATGKLNVSAGTFSGIPDGLYNGLPVMVVDEVDALGNSIAIGGVDYVVRARDEIAFARAITPNTATFYTRKKTDWSPHVGKKVFIAAFEWNIRSKWFDAMIGENIKAWDFLDLYFNPIPGGLAFLEIYTDFRPTVHTRYRVELDRGEFSIPITTLYHRHLQFRLKGYSKAGRVGFSLHRYNLRGRPQEWAARQHR